MLQRWSAEWERLKLQVSRENRRIPRWWQWMLIGAVGGAAAAGVYFSGSTNRQRLGKLVVVLGVFLILMIICTLMFMFWNSEYPGSVWMPRYLGVVWPALAIAVATLLLRLPTRPLRWAAIALLVGVNLSVFSARVFAGSEPPVPLMARDLIDSQPQGAKVRMYYGQIRAPHPGAPGGGTLTSVPGAYYLTILSGQPTSPRQMIGSFGGGNFGRFRRWHGGAMPLERYISRDIQQSPQIEQIIVWDRPQSAADDADAILATLGANWRRIDRQIFPVRDHWTWRHLYYCQRRVYERTGPPATLPATAPATTQEGP
jgi:hypothetical protein